MVCLRGPGISPGTYSSLLQDLMPRRPHCALGLPADFDWSAQIRWGSAHAIEGNTSPLLRRKTGRVVVLKRPLTAPEALALVHGTVQRPPETLSNLDANEDLSDLP